jgi:ribosomal protein S18 acetylase RimI-like enzyme
MQLTETAPTAARWSNAAYNAYCAPAMTDGLLNVKALFVANTIAEPTSSFQPVPGKIIGFAAFSGITTAYAGDYELENMAVAENWRRQGVGGRLLVAGLQWCRAWGFAGMSADRSRPFEKSIPRTGLWLEVRASNRGAIAFYERAGFRVTGHRPAYYVQPVEDAILMRKE